MFSESVWKSYDLFGYWVILEKHSSLCDCSYCLEQIMLKSLKLRLKLPEDKSWNSWRYIVIKLFGYTYYIRWSGRR